MRLSGTIRGTPVAVIITGGKITGSVALRDSMLAMLNGPFLVGPPEGPFPTDPLHHVATVRLLGEQILDLGSVVVEE